MSKIFPCRCFSSDCRATNNAQKVFYLDSLEEAPCPYCGRKGNIIKLEMIHLLVEDEKGTARGSVLAGTVDKKYAFQCEHARKNFDIYKQNPIRHYTTLPEAATCTECLLTYGARLTGQAGMKLPD